MKKGKITGILVLMVNWACLISRTTGRTQQNCEPRVDCIVLSDCPSLSKLSPNDFSTLLQRICGFDGNKSKVCCPRVSTGAPNTSESPIDTFTIGSNGPSEVSLLPEEQCGRPSTADRIIGGGPARIGAYPWVVALGYLEPGSDEVKFQCAGSLINSKYVLTAAHCVNQQELGRKRLTVLHLGDLDFSTEVDCQRFGRRGKRCQPKHIVAGFQKVLLHEQYNTRGRASDDIALIRLNITVDFDNVEAYVEPICLPERGIDVRKLIGKGAPVAAGWGLTEHGNFSNVLLRVRVQMKDKNECREHYKADFVTKQLCVGGNGITDTCSGDSGGPLIVSGENGPPFYQIGIVSFGPFPCALKNIPGVYTSVAEYRDWIIRNLEP